MPDRIGHLYTTYEVKGPGVTPAFMVGAILPDFTAMYADKYGSRPVNHKVLSGDLARGRAFHQETDAVFNRRPEFKEAETVLTESLIRQRILIGGRIKPPAAKLSAQILSKVMADQTLLEIPAEKHNVIKASEIALDGLVVLREITDSWLFLDTIESYLTRFPNVSGTNSDLTEVIYKRLKDRARQKNKNVIGIERKYKERTIKESQRNAMTKVIEAQSGRVGNLGLAALRATVQDLKNI